MNAITTFLMFYGQAEEAMNFYTSIFPNSKIESIARYGANQYGKEGSVMHASFSLNGQLFKCIDSPAVHAFGFTPAISISIDCDSVAETTELYNKLFDGGSVLMPLGEYPFSKQYAWFNDKFGVSWQLGYN